MHYGLARHFGAKEEKGNIDSNTKVRIKSPHDRIDDLLKRIIDLEEFTGLYNNNELENARTSEQIKSERRKHE